MNKWMFGLLVGRVVLVAQAGEMVVALESNGVLVAEGMLPGTSCTVEWASSLPDGFTNNPAPFEGLVADSNGTVRVAIPMFFRVRGTPEIDFSEDLVVIPAGINSGTDPGEGAYSLTNEAAFFMSATEVTKEQWTNVYVWAEENGYDISSGWRSKGAGHPVHTVSWYDCVKWCNARSEIEELTPCYTVAGAVFRTGQTVPDCNLDANGYRLPTNAEWEYAARGGLSGKRFPWGDTINHSNANYRANGSAETYDTSPYTTYTYHPDYNDGNSPYTSPAASFAPNGYGLYDMSGNVEEWCNDVLAGSKRAVRGGSWGNPADHTRCGDASRESSPTSRFDVLGFRVIRSVE